MFSSLLITFREVLETVLVIGIVWSFLSRTGRRKNYFWVIAGTFSGIMISIAGAFFFQLLVGEFKGTAEQISIKKFFFVMNILLLLFAAGLVSSGIHELSEAKIVPELIPHVWELNPPVNSDGTFPLFQENGAVGSIFKGLFGYRGDPSLAEVLSYINYTAAVSIVWIRNVRKKNIKLFI
jgi:high-affinity iron transporter